MRRLRRLDRRWVDRALASVLLLAGMVELFVRVDTPGLRSIAFAAVGYGTLFWRRSRPVAAGAVLLAMWILFNLFGDDVKSLQMPLMPRCSPATRWARTPTVARRGSRRS